MIEEVLDSIVNALKKAKEKRGKPDFYDTYEDCVEVYKSIKPHADYDYFPHKLFEKKAPNETPEEFNYRKGIYQPVTVPYFHKALGVTNRIWNEQNYDISWSNEEQRDYFYKEYPYWGNLESYFKQVVNQTTATDPNAVICVYPIDLQFSEDGVFNDAVPVTPVAEIFESKHIWAYKQDEYVAIRDYKSSLVKVGNTTKEEGIILWYFDRNEIYKLVQIGKQSDYEFESTLYYRHDMGMLPAKRLGGLVVQDDSEYFYQSFFSPAVPALNLALCDSSTLQMSKYAHAFLQKWEYTYECETCSGSGTEEIEGFEEKVSRACSGCGGSGQKSAFGPLSRYQIKAPDKFTTEPETKMQIPPAGFIELDHSVLEFLEKQVNSNLQKAFELLSIDVMNDEKISGRETATGKAIDREELYSFLLRYAECVFGTMERVIEWIGTMRFGAAWEMPAIRYPQTFEIRTDAELSAEMKEAPSFAQKTLAAAYADARFPIQESSSDRIKAIMNLDPLFGSDAKEVVAAVGAGIIPKWKAALHFEINYFLELAIEQNADFLMLERPAQRAIIEGLAKAAVPEVGLSVDSVLARIAQ